MPNNTKVSFVTNDGIFSGYASLWGVPDYFGDVVQKGAFTASLEQGGIKMLLHHDAEKPIGVWLELREDDTGLWVRGQLNMDTEEGRETKRLIEQGALNGLSIGFTDADTEPMDEGLRAVKSLTLWEISIVTFPAAEKATVDHVNMTDSVALEGVRYTKDGYMTAIARSARSGIQLYRGFEVGKPERKWVRVWRPEEEVFSADTMRSFAHRPVTLDHPPEAVTAENWKKYAHGDTDGEVIRDGRFVKVPLVLMDKGAIEEVRRGKRQLSWGYAAELEWKDGVGPDGPYDAIQRTIRANHLAVVTTARGGPDLRLGDSENNDDRSEDMTQKITVDGVQVEVVNDISAAVITRTLQALEKRAAELRSKMEEEEENWKKGKKEAKDALDAANATIATKDAEIATLKTQLKDGEMTPAKLDQMVKDRGDVIAKGKAIFGDALPVEGKTTAEIRRAVVDAKLGETAKGWSDAQVEASFTALSAASPAPANPLSAVIRDGLGNGADPRVAARSEQLKNLQDAWKQKVA